MIPDPKSYERLPTEPTPVTDGPSALHVIAHPDDEHAGVLTWLASRGYRTELWSWTRGEGGENLVGSERGQALAVRRAAELAAACQCYGVTYLRFAGAPDDGYARRLDSLWRSWRREELTLALASEIRWRRPTIVISRFFGGPGDGHAHHQASGVLVRDAVAAAADPELAINGLPPWRVRSTWMGQVPEGARVDLTMTVESRDLGRAIRGYKSHLTQDPDTLLRLVDHRRVTYQRLEGPPPPDGEGLFAGVPDDERSGRKVLRIEGALPAGDVPGSDSVPAVELELDPLAVVGGPPVRVTVVDAPGSVELRWKGHPRAEPVSADPGDVVSMALPPDVSSGPLELEAHRGGVGLGSGCVVELHTPIGFLRRVQRPATAVCAGPVLIDPRRRIGLVPGPRDLIDRALAALGATVSVIDPGEALEPQLAEVDTLLIAPRGYAAHPELAGAAAALRQFERDGGRVVVLRQTPEYLPERDAPFPGSLPADAAEACEVERPVELLVPEHSLMNAPNAITTASFAGWTRSLGAKFWSAWAPNYRPLVQLGDAGEAPQRGAWLWAPSGRGEYIYCALALEPQLAAGVAAGYQLLANLIGEGRRGG